MALFIDNVFFNLGQLEESSGRKACPLKEWEINNRSKIPLLKIRTKKMENVCVGFRYF